MTWDAFSCNTDLTRSWDILLRETVRFHRFSLFTWKLVRQFNWIVLRWSYGVSNSFSCQCVEPNAFSLSRIVAGKNGIGGDFPPGASENFLISLERGAGFSSYMWILRVWIIIDCYDLPATRKSRTINTACGMPASKETRPSCWGPCCSRTLMYGWNIVWYQVFHIYAGTSRHGWDSKERIFQPDRFPSWNWECPTYRNCSAARLCSHRYSGLGWKRCHLHCDSHQEETQDKRVFHPELGCSRPDDLRCEHSPGHDWTIERALAIWALRLQACIPRSDHPDGCLSSYAFGHEFRKAPRYNAPTEAQDGPDSHPSRHRAHLDW